MRNTLCNCITFLAIFSCVLPLHTHASTINAGDLIRGESWSSVYYLGSDGKRHAFPTESTFFSWYSDFSSVKTVTDQELGSITLGKNVTMKPGVKMIKVTTDPKTYAVEGGMIRPISNEQVAYEIYGAEWNKQIVDVPDTFFTNYKLGVVIETSDDYNAKEQREKYGNIDSVMNPVEVIGDIEYDNSEYATIVEEKDIVESSVSVEPCKIRTTIYSGIDTFRDSGSTVYADLSDINNIDLTIQHATGVVLTRFDSTHDGIVNGGGEWKQFYPSEGYEYETVLDLNVPNKYLLSMECTSGTDLNKTISTVSITIE